MEQCVLCPVGVQSDTEAMLFKPLPWLESGGLFARWRGTLKFGISEGADVPMALAGREPMGAAIGFLAMQGWVSGLIPLFVGLLAVFGPSIMSGIVGFGGGNAVAMGMLTWQVASYIALPLWICASVSVAAFGTSLLGASLGLGFRRAFVIIAFASGGLIFALIPFCGGLVGIIVWAVQASRAIAAALPPGRRVGPVFLALLGGFVAFLTVNVTWFVARIFLIM